MQRNSRRVERVYDFWQIKAATQANNPVFMTLYPVAHPVTECGQYVVRHGITGRNP